MSLILCAPRAVAHDVSDQNVFTLQSGTGLVEIHANYTGPGFSLEGPNFPLTAEYAVSVWV